MWSLPLAEPLCHRQKVWGVWEACTPARVNQLSPGPSWSKKESSGSLKRSWEVQGNISSQKLFATGPLRATLEWNPQRKLLLKLGRMCRLLAWPAPSPSLQEPGAGQAEGSQAMLDTAGCQNPGSGRADLGKSWSEMELAAPFLPRLSLKKREWCWLGWSPDMTLYFCPYNPGRCPASLTARWRAFWRQKCSGFLFL